MRVLFLDIDGVLNHRGVYGLGEAAPLCPDAMTQLKRVIDETGCKIVLSSTWRLMPKLVDKLPVAIVTGHFHGDWRTIEIRHGVSPGGVYLPTKRGEEIAEWLGRHPEVERYAIVDDDSDFLEDQLPFFVKTSFDAGGLTAECADRLIALLAPPVRADGGANIITTHTNIAGT
jgi:hypothetical protein